MLDTKGQNAMSVQIFNNPEFGDIRTSGTESEPLFCLADACRALELIPSKVVQRLSKHVLSKYPLKTNGGEQLANFVNEDGLYDVILDSRKPEAKKFRKWITSEVLPAIRKSGGYIASAPDEDPEEIMAKALIVAQRTIEANKQRLQMLQGENEVLVEERRVLKPKAEYTNEVLQSTSTYTLTQIAHDLDLRSVYVLTKWLSARGILFYQSKQWQPTSKVAGKGYFDTRTAKYVKNDETIGTSISTVVTEKGRMYLHSLLKERRSQS